MLPHDFISDLIVAIVLFALFASAGSVADKFGVFETNVDLEKISIDDEVNLFLLNYLKTETENGRISDLIVESEYDESKFEILGDETEDIMGFGLVESYDIKINYPDVEKRINNDNLGELKDIRLPSKNGNVLLIRGGIVFREENS